MATRSKRPTTTSQRSKSTMPTIVGIAVVVLVAVVVIGGVLLSGNGSDSSGGQAIPVTPAPAQYQTSVAGGVITAGGPAPHTVDVYEDALCPACQAFEQSYGERIAQGIASGKVQVRYHMVNLLEQRSSPPGYSSAAGGALMCAAENNAFPALHASLYAAQPTEGGKAYDTGQLVDLGQRAGAGPGYADCVTSGRHVAEVNQNFQAASTDPALQRQGSFGTPTIVVDGKLLQQQNTGDLDTALG
ncbi:membrane protein [Actinomycetospora sp. NBRC 106375]|uniref:DsbA family protein n=1 Tax=Actinomycetospora sp. NBRC 106375 TaxID=3032207 RepID=UPI0024A054E7|nr:thioredoxin domain-containing protein [Actinomycetospora sp. NBRC 106375]GLZ48491.1 membrane protein [Actinomycetospora sp. NBRC 106375]